MSDYSSGPVILRDAATLIAGESSFLIDAIAEAIQEQTGRSGLEDYCANAGSISDANASDITIEPINAGDKEVTGKFKVTFSESSYRGCRDVTWKDYYAGSGTFRIEVNEDAMYVEVEAQRVNEAGDYEMSEGDDR